MEITEQEQIDNAIKWLEALLSGKYKQTTEKLGDLKQGFCCWGLGCHIVGVDFDPTAGWNYQLGNKIGWWSSTGTGALFTGNYLGLASLNDNYNWTFETIGKYLIDNPTNFKSHVAEAITKYFANESDDNGASSK